jgi:hypothetical protein
MAFLESGAAELTATSYLEVIHPTFPVLASSKARVQSLLWQSPLGLQNAFYNAFFSMIKHFLQDSSGQLEGDPATTWNLLHEWESEGKPRSPVTDLVRFQTLVMAVISVDCHGIASVKGQLGGPSKDEILGRAAGLGHSMKVYRRTLDPDPSPELDPNSDDNVALRAWWVLVMLDRWNALGMATSTSIAHNIGVPRPGLKHIVGDAVFALIRKFFRLHCQFRLPDKSKQAPPTPSRFSFPSSSTPTSTHRLSRTHASVP